MTSNQESSSEDPCASLPTFTNEGVTFQCIKAPGRNDVVEQMTKPQVFGTVDDKKAVITAVFERRQQVLGRLPGPLKTKFERLLPESLPQDLKNGRRFKGDNVASLIFDLNQIFQSFKNDPSIRISRTDTNIEDVFKSCSTIVELATTVAFNKSVADSKKVIVK